MRALGLAGRVLGGLVESGPQVQANRCLRASGSGCRACVDICPADALRLGPQGSTAPPQSERSRCTDCGLCAATCPSGAIDGVGVPPAVLTRQAERFPSDMMVLCATARRERLSGENVSNVSISSEDRTSSVSCLAALHPETVVATALALQPESTLTLARAQCSQCPSAQQARVDAVAQESADLLRRLDNRGRKIVLSAVLPTASIAGRQQHHAADRQHLAADRQHRAADRQRVAAERQHPSAQPEGAGRRWSRRELLTAGRSGARAAPAPAVTPARAELFRGSADPSPIAAQLTHPVDALGCRFCHACAAVCPTQALQIHRLPADDSGLADGGVRLELAVDPRQCVGCGRCAQVCVDGLLTLGCGPEPLSPLHGRVRRLVVVAQGERSTCHTCMQPLAPGEQGVCCRCESARTLVMDFLAQ